MDDVPDLEDDEAAIEAALARIPSEPSEALKAAIREERARGGGLIHRADPETHRRAVEGIIALGGSDPNAWAPGRRRYR